MTKWQCIRNGGHYWEPVLGTLIDWQCIRCDAETDGSPKDGTGWINFIVWVSILVVLCILMGVVIASSLWR